MGLARIVSLLSVVNVVAQYERSYQPAGAYFGHQTGYAFQSTQWQTGVTQPKNVYMTYGPYATDAPASTNLMMTVTLQVDNNVADDNELAVLDVHDADSNEVYASMQVNRKDFVQPNTNQDFTLPFTTPPGPCKLVSAHLTVT